MPCWTGSVVDAGNDLKVDGGDGGKLVEQVHRAPCPRAAPGLYHLKPRGQVGMDYPQRHLEPVVIGCLDGL